MIPKKKKVEGKCERNINIKQESRLKHFCFGPLATKHHQSTLNPLKAVDFKSIRSMLTSKPPVQNPTNITLVPALVDGTPTVVRHFDLQELRSTEMSSFLIPLLLARRPYRDPSHSVDATLT